RSQLLARRPPPPGHEPGDDAIGKAAGPLSRGAGRYAVRPVERHGGEGAPAVWRKLEVQWLTRHLAAHRGNAVIRPGRELEHDGRAFEWRARTPGETRRPRDTLRGRTRHTEERDQGHDRSDNAATHHDHRRAAQPRRQETRRPPDAEPPEPAD